MALEATIYVWQTSKQKSSTLLAHLAIADYADPDTGECYPSINKLALKLRMTERNAQLLVRKLETDGDLKIEEHKGAHTASGSTNRYTLLGYVQWLKEVNSISPLKKKGVKSSSSHEVKAASPDGVKPTSPRTVIEQSIEPNMPNGKMEDLIKAWLDTAKVIKPSAYQNTTIRGEATGLFQAHITTQDVTDYVTELLTKPFYQTKGVTFSDIATGIVTWKEYRTPNGHGTDIEISDTVAELDYEADYGD